MQKTRKTKLLVLTLTSIFLIYLFLLAKFMWGCSWKEKSVVLPPNTIDGASAEAPPTCGELFVLANAGLLDIPSDFLAMVANLTTGRKSFTEKNEVDVIEVR